MLGQTGTRPTETQRFSDPRGTRHPRPRDALMTCKRPCGLCLLWMLEGVPGTLTCGPNRQSRPPGYRVQLTQPGETHWRWQLSRGVQDVSPAAGKSPCQPLELQTSTEQRFSTLAARGSHLGASENPENPSQSLELELKASQTPGCGRGRKPCCTASGTAPGPQQVRATLKARESPALQGAWVPAQRPPEPGRGVSPSARRAPAVPAWPAARPAGPPQCG